MVPFLFFKQFEDIPGGRPDPFSALLQQKDVPLSWPGALARIRLPDFGVV